MQSMDLVLHLLLPADAKFLTKTRHAVAGYMEDAGSPESACNDVALALDEACANAIRHAYPEGAAGPIRVMAEIGEDSVVVQVEDDGVGFDPFDVDLENIGVERTSGRGLSLIRLVMSKVDIESPTVTGGTRVRMERDLTEPDVEQVGQASSDRR